MPKTDVIVEGVHIPKGGFIQIEESNKVAERESDNWWAAKAILGNGVTKGEQTILFANEQEHCPS